MVDKPYKILSSPIRLNTIEFPPYHTRIAGIQWSVSKKKNMTYAYVLLTQIPHAAKWDIYPKNLKLDFFNKGVMRYTYANATYPKYSYISCQHNEIHLLPILRATSILKRVMGHYLSYTVMEEAAKRVLLDTTGTITSAFSAYLRDYFRNIREQQSREESQPQLSVDMDKWTGKVALVTGASSGIGAATARALVHHGMVVVGLARRVERVQELAEELAKAGEPGKLFAVKADMRKEEDILEAYSWVEKQLGGVDVLVNNAGVFHTTYLSEATTEEWREILEVNVLAVCICTREYLKSMERRNNQHGHIVTISSGRGSSTE
ncbi:Dehydrogenase/reductase SDR member 11 [Homalodisca vitripennis]|nr:Dehydrogenase/reductase SDR member 11 [Homalodisca vitripennis]